MGDQYPIPAADVEIPDLVDDDEVWRRIPPLKIVFDANLMAFRPAKDNFVDNPTSQTPMSCYLARKCNDPLQVLAGHEGFALVAIKVETLRSCNLRVLDAPRNHLPPGHVHVVGDKPKQVQKKIARECRWVVEPSDEMKARIRSKQG